MIHMQYKLLNVGMNLAKNRAEGFMNRIHLFLAIFGLSTITQAEYLNDTSHISAAAVSATNNAGAITPQEELQLDDILIKIYGDVSDAELAKQSLYERLLSKSKVNASLTRGGSDCFDSLK